MTRNGNNQRSKNPTSTLRHAVAVEDDDLRGRICLLLLKSLESEDCIQQHDCLWSIIAEAMCGIAGSDE